MSEPFVDRRGFLAGCVGAAGLLILPSAGAAVDPEPSSGVTVMLDPAIEEAAAFSAALSRQGSEGLVVRGDRYRLIRGLLSAAGSPFTFAGVSTYADFIVLTGALREARYDLVSHGLHSASRPTDHRCFGRLSGCEPILRRSGAMWPAALAGVTAGVIAGRTAKDTRLQRPAAFGEAGGGTLLSWVVQSISLRRIA